MFESPLGCSMLKRAQEKDSRRLWCTISGDYTTDKHRKVDDYPFGGEAGMVMKVQPVEACINALKAERDYDEVIFTSPDGQTFNQKMANNLSMLENVIILCGHYKGGGLRIREHLVTMEISVGDYVLTGGRAPRAGHDRRHGAPLNPGSDRRRCSRPCQTPFRTISLPHRYIRVG